MTCIRINRIELLGGTILYLALLMLVCTGCDDLEAIQGLFDPKTRVEVTNNGDYVVDAVFFIGDEQDIPRELLTELGERVELSIEPGQTVPIVRDCETLQAIVLDDADLRVIGGVGPETDSDVLRDGTDFACRDSVTFTFDHSNAIVDFNVVTDRRPN